MFYLTDDIGEEVKIVMFIIILSINIAFVGYWLLMILKLLCEKLAVKSKLAARFMRTITRTENAHVAPDVSKTGICDISKDMAVPQIAESANELAGSQMNEDDDCSHTLSKN